MTRPMTMTERYAEQRAFDSTMRIFGRYGCDPRTETVEKIKKVMDRMNSTELETVALAQQMVMRMNGVQPHMRLN